MISKDLLTLDRRKVQERQELFHSFADYLWSSKEKILAILSETSTYRFANDEFMNSLAALHGAPAEIERSNPARIRRLAVYAPSNVLLYSYILYCIIPLLFTDEVCVRPSVRVKQTHLQLHRLLNQEFHFPIHFLDTTQRQFWDSQACSADAIVFTGRYENACQLEEQLHLHQLLLFFGSGVNPVIVGPQANLLDAVSDTVMMRTLNSGQDCICPDAIFVHEHYYEQFLALLRQALMTLPVGKRENSSALISPLYYEDVVQTVQAEIQSQRHLVMYGGEVDPARNWVAPTILASTLETMPPLVEYFSPVFNIVRYDFDEKLLQRLNQPDFTEQGMGLSLYGAPWLAAPLARWHTVALDCSFLAIEDGNRPFGGFGKKANFSSYRGKRSQHPLLISREVGKTLGQEEKE